MNAPESESPRPIVSTSVHLEPEVLQQLDQLAVRWRVSRSGAMRKLVKATVDSEHVARVEELTFIRQPVLPHARKYKFISPWKGMIGIDNLSFARGQVISRDGMLPELIQKLFQRGAQLEAVPD